MRVVSRMSWALGGRLMQRKADAKTLCLRQVVLRIVSCAALLVATQHQSLAASNAEEASSPTNPPRQTTSPLSLGISQARALAIQYNLSLILSRAEREQGELIDDQARSPYVPFIAVDLGYSDQVSLVANDERNRSLSYGAQTSWTLPQGTGLFARLEALEFLSGASFVPTPTNTLQVGLSQPFLRGLGQGVDQLDAARAQARQQKAIFLNELNSFLLEVEQAYWSLSLAQNDVAIRIRSIERAQTQYDEMTENIRRGLVAEGEIFIVEENLVFFSQQLIRSKETLELAQATLARLIRVDPSTEIIATDDLSTQSFDPPPSYEESLAIGLEYNPAVQSARELTNQRRELYEVASNQYRPQLDLNAAATLSGIDPSRLSAWQQVFTARQPGWRVGLDFSVPLDRSPDRARREAAEIALSRATTAEEDARDDVRYGLKQALTRWQRRLEVLQLAENRMRLAMDKLEVEQEKYKSGLSTLANVVLFQRDLDSARQGLQTARYDVILATARHHQLQGTLAASAGVEVD